jgi:cytochrome P450
MIRWQTPVIHMRRTATRDAELAGKTHRAGRQGGHVVRLGQSRRERDRRSRGLPHRPAQGAPALAFGAGIHRCVGDRLAELQLQILWREMLKRNLRPEIVGEPVRVYSNFLRGIRSLPVILRD